MKLKLILALSFSLSLVNAMEMASFLPADTARDICLYGTESLNDARKIIGTFTQTCKIFETSFNDSNRCLYLIKKLSARFDCSNEEVAETLRIKASRQRYYLQGTLKSYCRRFANLDGKIEPRFAM